MIATIFSLLGPSGANRALLSTNGDRRVGSGRWKGGLEKICMARGFWKGLGGV